MNPLIVILFLIMTPSTFAQETDEVTVFHRLLIFNSSKELMVVKIRDTDFWVTPGLYQNDQQFIQSVLDSIAASYGITTSAPKLRGVFMLRRTLDQQSSASIRNVFSAELQGGALKKPEGIEAIRWLPVEEALTKITFPHINRMIEQIVQNPDTVWGGSLLQYKEGDAFKSKLLEDFYPLFTR